MVRARWPRSSVLLMVCALTACAGLLGGTAPERPAASVKPDYMADPHNCGGHGVQVPAGDICRGGIATPAPAR